MRVNEDSEDWVVIGLVPGARQLAFQRAPKYVPPRWPVLRLGPAGFLASVRPAFGYSPTPAGHPFCLVFGRSGA